ncbi:hypothetical protein [Chromobacterium sp.]|uniref:hypothetical protein n=1 Tax=Chromobacterium sp. TaxID=306190 RepID=UPI0035B0E852
MITNDQLAELERMARAATPGPWRAGRPREIVSASEVCVDTDIGPKVLLAGNSNFIAEGERNAAFVAAADPATVLALVAELAGWRKLKDPNVLFNNMLAGIPARLSAETLLHLAGDQYQGMAARIAELEQDAARLDYMIENGLFVEAFIMPDLPKMPPLCWLVNFRTGPIDKKQFEDPRAAIDAAMAPPRCTCPSGDGSLRWPCPRHPPESA